MGFYIEMKKSNPLGLGGEEFKEASTPQVFWALFGLAGFALTCMGLAAHSLLSTLLKTGDIWDLLLVSAIFSCVPIYLTIGLKLIWVRRFVSFNSNTLVLGYRFGHFPFWFRRVSKQQVVLAELVNLRPSSNLAPLQHRDSQYFVRGHWRLVLKLRNGKRLNLDRHTEQGALLPLYHSVLNWLNPGSGVK